MLTRTVRIQLVVFVVASLVAIAYMAVRYVGVLRMLGQSGYQVKVQLAQTGGLFTNGEVDYRGVPVGRVGGMKLTASGIEVTLNMNSSDKIPSNVKAVVANRSVIGEQYLDLQPQTDSGPYLKDGSVIAQSRTTLPPPLSSLLLSTNQFLQSVPINALQTTVNELYLANQNLGPNLQRLLTTSQDFFTTATQNLPANINLINQGKIVLDTQVQESDAIQTFSENLKLFNQTLAADDGDLRTLIDTTPAAAAQIAGLITDLNSSLSLLVTNLTSVSGVFLASGDSLKQIMGNLPIALSAGASLISTKVVDGKTITAFNAGLVPTFFDPLPCTAGYQGTVVHPGLSTTTNGFNTNAQCTSPPSTGIDVRGSQNAPSGS
jgi:phospholipid/cholesterol/gamma-HCH transport system substrate-binding protein